jgi:hypothetical protein
MSVVARERSEAYETSAALIRGGAASQSGVEYTTRRMRSNDAGKWSTRSNASAVKSRLKGHQAPSRAPLPIEGESRRRKGRFTTDDGDQTWELSNSVDDVSTCSEDRTTTCAMDMISAFPPGLGRIPGRGSGNKLHTSLLRPPAPTDRLAGTPGIAATPTSADPRCHRVGARAQKSQWLMLGCFAVPRSPLKEPSRRCAIARRD